MNIVKKTIGSARKLYHRLTSSTVEIPIRWVAPWKEPIMSEDQLQEMWGKFEKVAMSKRRMILVVRVITFGSDNWPQWHIGIRSYNLRSGSLKETKLWLEAERAEVEAFARKDLEKIGSFEMSIITSRYAMHFIKNFTKEERARLLAES